MTLQEYWDELHRHDWTYCFSDDARVYSMGRKEEVRLKALKFQSEEHAKMFDQFVEHYSSGPDYGTTKVPKPTRPGGNDDTVPAGEILF